MNKILIIMAVTALILLIGEGWSDVAAQENYHQADSLRQLFYDRENIDSAIVYANKALLLVEKQYGKNDTLYADMLYELVGVYNLIGDYEKAIEYSQEEVAIRKDLQGPKHVDYGTSIGMLGELYSNTGQYQKALPLFLEALENCENSVAKEDYNYGYHLNNLALLYTELGRYEEALPLFLEALENTEKSLGRDHVNYGIRLSNLSLLYQKMGQFQMAVSASLEALENTEKAYGKEHSQYGTRLNNLALVYYEMGQYDKALPLLMEALENCEKSLGKAHEVYGIRLHNLAYLYQAMGQYQEALPLFLESLENTERNLGKEHPDYGVRLCHVASVYQAMGQYQEALPLYLEALENTIKYLGIEHPDYATRLGYLASLYSVMGQYNDALELYQKALENTEKSLGKEHPNYGTQLNNLAGLYSTLGQYQEALPLYLEALEICEKSLGKSHPDYGIRLNNLAGVYKAMNQYKKALPIYIEALENAEKTLGKEHDEYATRLNSLAGYYRDLGQYNSALPLYLEALENTEKTFGKEHPKYGSSLNSLAVMYRSMGLYENASSTLLEALEITEKTFGKEHYRYGVALNNLATVYSAMGRDQEALALLLQVAENFEKSLGKAHPTYGVILANLASSYKDMGQYEKALPLFLEALDNCERSVGKQHSYYGIYLGHLAGLYKAMGQYEKALPLYIEAQESCERILGKKHPNNMNFLSNLAGLYKTMGLSAKTPEERQEKYQLALPFYEKAIENVNQHISQNFAYLSEKEKEAYFDSKSKYFDRYNSFALLTKSQFNDITASVYNNTMRNKSILLKSSTAMRTAVLNSNDSLLTGKYDRWIQLKKEITTLYTTPVAKRQQDISQLEEQATILERDLVSSSQEFSAFTQSLKINWKDVRKTLKTNEMAIEFVHFKDGEDTTVYCALMVSPASKQPDMVPLFREKQLEEILGKYGGNNYNYINAVYGNNSEMNTSLYKLIWAPIDSIIAKHNGEFQIQPNAKLKIYLSPSGLLHKISFSAIAKNQNVYLSDVYDIEIKTTTAQVVETHQLTQSNLMTSTGLFGGINYSTDSTRIRVWNYLEGTKTEIEKINMIVRKGKAEVNYYTDNTATEETFKNVASNSSLLHIATHGFFYPDPKEATQGEVERTETGALGFGAGNRGFGVWSFAKNENPLMRSGLVFAGANDVWNRETEDETEDGVLTAQEVVQLDMRNTDLVVLSACETGLGDIKGSEGVYGLQRSFKMAGVRYLIMSLWQVPDKETVELMTSFYKKLVKQGDVKNAFSETQQKMRQKYDPYYWAAFVLIE